MRSSDYGSTTPALRFYVHGTCTVTIQANVNAKWINKMDKQEYIAVGCVPPASVAFSGEGSAQVGCLPRGGVSVHGECVCGGGGEQNDRCKNITLPQLRLQAVTNNFSTGMWLIYIAGDGLGFRFL